MEVLDGFSKSGKKDCPVIVAGFLNGHFVKGLMKTSLFPHWRDGGTTERAIAEFSSTLRRLVDQWIDSGKSEGDTRVDTPYQRSIHWVSPVYAEPIENTLMAFRTSSPPRVLIQGDGRYLVTMQPLFPKPTDPLTIAREYAIYFFVLLLDSPTRERLSRCDACGKYFVRERAPKKDTPIFHGTYCKDCKRKGSESRTVDSRNARKKQMIEFAADWWPKWQQRNGKRPKWVASKVNRQRKPKGWGIITGKWITQNQTAIEEEVQRRSYAKS